ncbi:PD-(D/E)XK nuclease family protein [Salinarchaeum sp. IM2453]|uniref:PD-(D/E)XK nuclease family protein n=1 Tax=Salinarchaeum sp. IM2453 TaxID=2862870 RepID=UPI001C8395FB|nr:PD-(D/E)XK nuclease family protein [Salinarchaeum sp. IM2453]QZA89545.1 PD-(D/E)XK nuclease family protein [Salinarchaeum sp. IM2453]
MVNNSPASHVDWSYSTARLYHKCPRQFYYQHRQREEKDTGYETQSSTAVQPPGARIGSVVHDCIAEKIEHWRNSSKRTLQDSQEAAAASLQQYVAENSDEIRDSHFTDEDEFDPDEFAQSLIQTAQSHIKTFFQVIWPQFNSHRYITHEITRSFSVDEHTVWVRPDFCTRSQEGDLVITDWKTGAVDRFSEPTLQVLTYALWAHREYEPDLDRILVQLVHTKHGEFDRTRPDRVDLDSIKNQIRTDREDWTTFQSMNDYQPDPETEKCKYCTFLDRCDAGQMCIDKGPD